MTLDAKLKSKLFKNSPVSDKEIDEIISEKRVPTVSPSINWALEGGIVPGRFYCFVGPESAGKSMFAVSCCVEMLKNNPNGRIIWFDTEESFTTHWLDIFMKDEDGFNDDDRKGCLDDEKKGRFIVKQVKYGRDIFDHYIDDLTQIHDSGVPILSCVIDSKDCIIPPKEESRQSTEDHTMAALAGYLPAAFRKMISPSRIRKTSWIFISQVGMQFDEMQKRLGNRYTMSGGKKFLHYMDAILLFEQLEGKVNKIFDDEKVGMDGKPVQLGCYIKMKVNHKCRVGVPNRVAVFKFIYKEGVVGQWEEIAKLAVGIGIVNKEGRTYFYQEGKLGVSEGEYLNKVKEDEKLQEELYTKIMES